MLAEYLSVIGICSLLPHHHVCRRWCLTSSAFEAYRFPAYSCHKPSCLRVRLIKQCHWWNSWCDHLASDIQSTAKHSLCCGQTPLLCLQGPYVLVMVATGQHQKSNKLPAMWLISAYRNLSRPFRKNVRYILLVRPTGGLKALVACIRPFVSGKAAKKVKQVSTILS